MAQVVFATLITLALLLITYTIVLVMYIRSCHATSGINGLDVQNAVPVTIVIAARNEEDNILECVSSCLDQDYPEDLLEVIVVDDQSEDDTYTILENQVKDSRFKLMRLGVWKRTTIVGSKKKALSYGINHAQGSMIFTTDGDCIVPRSWVRNGVAVMQNSDARIGTGPLSIAEGRGFLHHFQVLDTAVTNLIHCGGQRMHVGTLGTGANLVFYKEDFIRSNCYEDNMQIASGDDVFLIRSLEKTHPGKSCYLKSRDSMVKTFGLRSLSAFFSQRLRWSSKMKYMKNGTLTAIAYLIFLARWVPLTLVVVSLIFQNNVLLIAGTIALAWRWILEFVVNLKALDWFSTRNSLWWFFPANVFYSWYILILGVFGFLPLNLEWKDRKI